MNTQALEMIIAYAPFGIFLIAVLWALIVGLIRGFRKSLILFIQALIAAAICIIIFYVLVNNPNTDKLVLNITSKFVDFNKELGTTTEYQTMREVLVDYILKQQGYGDSMRLIMEENGAYLDTLVNLMYRIILFIPLIIVFFVLDFIFYIVYLIFYPERRKREKLRKRERNGDGSGYKKHALLGGVIGMVRGAVVGVVWLSFIGAIFFIVAGGTGDDSKDSYPDYTFTNESLATTYDTYKIVSSYGNTGIFRVLNTFKDSENVPYYLFAANMILSGNLKDGQGNRTVRFTKELSCYTSFVNSTIKLVLKYDTDGKINEAITNNDSASLTNILDQLMAKEEFKAEYDALIESFDAGTYFINFGLSFVNSIVAHRNELAFTDNLDSQIIDLLDIVFDGDHKIAVSDILTEGDARNLMKSIVKVLSVQTAIDENTDGAKKGFLYAKAMVPQLLELSIFTDDARKAQFNPLLEDIYQYVANNVVKTTASTNASLAKSEFDLTKALADTNASESSVSWVDELKMLLETSIDLVDIVDSVYGTTDDMMQLIFNIFPSDNEEVKTANLTHFNNLINNLSTSKLLDSVLSLTVVRDTIDNTLAGLSESIQLPSKINYVNTYDSSGNVKTYGEIYVLLTALKELILNDNTKDLVTTLQSGEYSTSVLKSISELFTETLSDGTSSLIDISLKSTVLKYILSGVFFGVSEKEDLGVTIVIPSNLCETDSDNIVTITDSELKNLFTSLAGSIDIFAEDGTSIDFKKVIDNVSDLTDSQIIEATVVNLLYSSIKDVSVVSIPEAYATAGTLESLKGDFSNNVWHTSGEISNIVYGLDEIFNVSALDTFDLEASLSEIQSKFGDLTATANRDESKTKLDIVYESAIFRSTVKNFVVTNIPDTVIDTNLLNSSAVVVDIDGVSSIKKDEVLKVIYSFKELALDFANIDFSNISSLITSINGAAVTPNYEKKIDVLYDSTVVKYIIAKQLDKALANTSNLIESAVVNSSLVKTTETYDSNNYQYYTKSEISNLIDSIGVFGITDINSIDPTTIKNSILNLDNDKLTTLYGSNIIKYAIAKQLDNALTETIVSNDVRNSTLVKGYNKINGTDYGYYLQTELLAMINSLKQLNITDIDNFTVSDIKSQITTFNDKISAESETTKLGVLYDSYVIKYALAERFDSIFTDATLNVHADVLNANKKNDELDSNYYYYLQESVAKMIDAFGTKGLNITNLDSVDDISANTILNLNEIPDGASQSRLSTIYASDIIAYILTSKLEGVFNSNEILVDDIDAKYAYSTNVNLYKQTELECLIKALKDFGVTDVSSVNSTVFVLNETVRENIIESTIMFDTVSNMVFKNSALVSPAQVKTTNSDGSVTKICDADQMRYLINTLISLHYHDVSDTEIKVTLNSDVINNICDSYILRATASKNILGNANIKVATANIDSLFTDYAVIKKEELKNTLNAVSTGLGISDLSNISSTISLPGKSDENLSTKLAAISKSQIIRTTITGMLEFKDDSNNTIDLYVLADDSDVLIKQGTTSTNLLSIKEAEMNLLLTGLVTAFGGNSSTSTGGTVDLGTLKGMTSEDLNTFMASSTILLITDKILGDPTVVAAYTAYCTANLVTPVTDTETKNVYLTTDATFTAVSRTYLALNTQKDMISKVPSV